METRPFALLALTAGIVLVFGGVAGAGSETGTITFVRSVNRNMEVFTMNGDGTNCTQVTTLGYTCSNPSLSPDGTRILFEAVPRGGSKNSEIFTIGIDGSGPRQLTENRAYDGQAEWSPDGKRIVFISQSVNPAGEIYVMDADGSNVTRLTNNHDVDVTPAWSPDGSKIAFACRPLLATHCNIFVMNADGTGTERLTKSFYHEAFPVWSPDGTKIAYCSIDAGSKNEFSIRFQGGIWVMNADGSGQKHVKGTHHTDSHPSWSPDGMAIVFGRQDAFLNFELYVIRPGQDTKATNLTNSRDKEGDPSWHAETPVSPTGP